MGPPTRKLPKGEWWFVMATDFDEEAVGQRRQSETAMDMLEQHRGDSLSALKHQTRRREMSLMCVTHNVMVL